MTPSQSAFIPGGPGSRPATHIPGDPSIAVVVGTYGSPAYIGLGLEARRRFWPRTPILVHDDSSDEQAEIVDICERYGAEFVSTKSRLGHLAGDIATIVAGLDWAAAHGYDILVKLSRRYIIYHEWTGGLAQLAYNSQYATYTNACSDFRRRLRSECIGFHVSTWLASSTMKAMRECVATGRAPMVDMEQWYYEQALAIHRRFAAPVVRQREHSFPRSREWAGYGVWTMLGNGRQTRAPGVLWHHADLPEEYRDLAVQWGLGEYPLEAFRDTGYRVSHNARPGARATEAPQAARTDPKRSARSLADSGFKALDPASCGGEFRVAGPLAASLFAARRERRLDNTLFDIALFAAAPNRKIIVPSWYDTPCFVDTACKLSVQEGALSPQREDVSRFVCRRISEHGGDALVVGEPPVGLLQTAARELEPAREIVCVAKDVRHLAGVLATAAANGFTGARGFAAAAPEDNGDGFSWLDRIAAAALRPVDVLVVNLPGDAAESLAHLSPLIRRDRPELVFYVRAHPRSRNLNDDVGRIDEILRSGFGYTPRCIVVNGQMTAFEVRFQRHPSPAYAWYK